MATDNHPTEALTAKLFDLSNNPGVARPRLFHFSEDPSIETFTPRPVAAPSPRPPGQDWLNGSLVWAVDERRQATYLFPRDCPRLLV